MYTIKQFWHYIYLCQVLLEEKEVYIATLYCSNADGGHVDDMLGGNILVCMGSMILCQLVDMHFRRRIVQCTIMTVPYKRAHP